MAKNRQLGPTTIVIKIQTAHHFPSSNPCKKIEIRDINIAYNGGGGRTKPACANAYGASYGQEHPPSCLLA
ncbi:hypothetical protein QYF36_018314 [Acer negundo]|nr:hypothetical protein QYF36_018314 [Acer negundo]